MVRRRRSPSPARSPPIELVGHRDSGPRNGTWPSMPSRHQLVLGEHVVLEVAVLGVRLGLPARLHGAERAHAAVGLVLLAVDEDQLAGALLAAGQQAAEHDGVGAGHDRLGDVAGVLHAAVADHRHAGRRGRPRAASMIAVTCGTPTPATTRVVQIEPGPDARP